MIGRNDRDRDVSSGKFKRHVFFRFKASDFNISRIYTSPRVYFFFFLFATQSRVEKREKSGCEGVVCSKLDSTPRPSFAKFFQPN